MIFRNGVTVVLDENNIVKTPAEVDYLPFLIRLIHLFASTMKVLLQMCVCWVP
jgi:hypothetical protein